MDLISIKWGRRVPPRISPQERADLITCTWTDRMHHMSIHETEHTRKQRAGHERIQYGISVDRGEGVSETRLSIRSPDPRLYFSIRNASSYRERRSGEALNNLECQDQRVPQVMKTKGWVWMDLELKGQDPNKVQVHVETQRGTQGNRYWGSPRRRPIGISCNTGSWWPHHKEISHFRLFEPQAVAKQRLPIRNASGAVLHSLTVTGRPIGACLSRCRRTNRHARLDSGFSGRADWRRDNLSVVKKVPIIFVWIRKNQPQETQESGKNVGHGT
ncbi:hypothetical protein BV22DRAFT_147643 [Leucogyrophana mollusca]|uniref:Uncharacterized protein n=1 Tax=Leucogyrophana mollusca TaxID=85980 RepID=A0ACB8BVU1_9AGAM|nr:hypothetical protein BV22DRAFT_147643 [Leucogyrophana mollusca]